MIEILVPNYYDSDNVIFNKIEIKKKFISKKNKKKFCITKNFISKKIKNNLTIIDNFVKKEKPWNNIIFDVINENYYDRPFKVTDIENIIKKQNIKIPDKGLNPYFTKLYKKNKVINKDNKKGFWYLIKNI